MLVAKRFCPGWNPPPEVVGRRIGDDVDQSALEVGRQRRPGRHVTGILPGVVLPGVKPELALRLRDDVELPLEVPGGRVVPEHVPRHVLPPRLPVALLVRVPDHDDPVDDDRGRRIGDGADLLGQPVIRVELVAEVRQQVDRAVVAKARDRTAGLGIQRVQEERRRHDVDPPGAVRPRVGHAFAVVLPHRIRPPLGVGLAEGPQRLAGRRVDGGNGPPLPCHAEELPFGIDRGRAEDHVGAPAVVVSPPDPGHLELLEVVGVDLIQRRIALTLLVATPVAPPALLRQGG